MVAVSSTLPPPSFAGVDTLWPLTGPGLSGAALAGPGLAGPARVDRGLSDPSETDRATDVEGRPEVTTSEKIARRFFELCENPRTQPRVVRLLQHSADSAVAGRLLVAFISRMVFRPFVRSKRLDHAAARFEIVAAQLGGIAVLRYISRMEPLASMPLDDLVRLVAPAIDATITAAPAA